MITTQKKTVGDEPLPGYRLVSLLGQGGFGEVWKCQVPGGMYKAIKFVPLETAGEGVRVPGAAKQELRAFEHIKNLRHPFLLSLERVEVTIDEVIVVSELADRSLADRLEECQQIGQRGIPRQELLGYLIEAAEALDVLNFQYGLQHLDVKPNNLLLLGDHTKVADFGLVTKYNALSSEAIYNLPGLTPLYSPPELLRGSISSHSDQYSLAIVYQELLTGVLPFRGKNRQALTVLHLGAEPDLSSLPAKDQLIVRKALSKAPLDRYPSCTEFVNALLGYNDESLKRTRSLARSTIIRRFTHEQPETCAEITSGTSNLEEVNHGGEEPKEKLSPVVNPIVHDTDPHFQGRETLLCGVTEFFTRANLKPLDQLSTDCLGEVWKVQTAEGELWHARWLDSQLIEASEEDAIGLLNFLETLYHPSLPQWELVRIQTGQWMLATEINQGTLWDRMRKHIANGKQGIPREELLDYMLQLSTFLDAFAAREIHHFCLNPKNILLSSDHIVLLDFGLIHHLWKGKGRSAQAINPHYSPPEMRDGRFHAASDQYTLAMMFVELLTGSHPPGLSKRAARGVDCDRNLALVASADETVLRRALHKNPEKRFSTCSDFVHALARDGRLRKRSRSSGFPEVVRIADLDSGRPPSSVRPVAKDGENLGKPPEMDPQQFITQLLVQEVGPFLVRKSGAIQYLEYSETRLDCCMPVRAIGNVFDLKLKSFADEHNATFRRQQGKYVMTLLSPGTFWQQLLGTTPRIEFRVEYHPPTEAKVNLSQARVQIEVLGRPKNSVAEELKSICLRMLNRFRAHVQDAPDHRKQIRLPLHQQVLIYPITSNTEWGTRIVGETKDVSIGGVGIRLHEPIESKYVYLVFPQSQSLAELAVLGKIVRIRKTSDHYEVGVLVNPPKQKTPEPPKT